MRVLVVHDSAHGNTEEIARAVGGAITGQVQVIRVGHAKLSDMSTFDLIIIGSPTQGGKTTQAIQNFVNSMPASAGRGRVAAFDTRMSSRWVGAFGYAAGRIANAPQGKGWPLAAPAEGFFVRGREGPLKEGEVERAAVWAKAISARKF